MAGKSKDVARVNNAVLKVSQEFLGDFNPQTSSRERRKLARSNIYKANYTNAIHDRDGKMIEEGTDFCDCLEPTCSGCHFPCVKCGSPKCSVDCRKNRKWTCDLIELEGINKTWTLKSALKTYNEQLSAQLVAKTGRKMEIQID